MKSDGPRIIAIANRKGGCAKSSTAVNLSAALANEGYRVLVIDLDSQANATTHLISGLKPFTLSSSDFLVSSINGHKVKYSDVVIVHEEHHGNLRIIPANDHLYDAEDMIREARYHAENGQKEEKKDNEKDRTHFTYLKKSLETIDEDLDFIIIDTPPGDSFILLNALAASQFVLMPGNTDPGSIDGFKRIVRLIQNEILSINPEIRLLGIVATKFNSQTHLAKAFVKHVEKTYPNALLNARIRQDIKIPEAHSKGGSIYEVSPYSNGALDYMQLMYEIVVKTGRKAGESHG